MTNNLTELTLEDKISIDLDLNSLSIYKANEILNRIFAKIGANQDVVSTNISSDRSLKGRSDFGTYQLISLVQTLENLEAVI